MQLGAGAKALGHARAQLAQALFNLRLHHLAVAAHRAHQGDLARNDAHGAGVAALHGAQADHRLVKGRDIARHYALYRRDQVAGHQHRVHRLVGPGAMAAFAAHQYLNAVHRRLHGAGGHADHAQGCFGRVVLGKHLFAGKAFKQAVFHHGAGAGKAFFAGLKNQHGRAVKVSRFYQVARRAHQHGGVAVVAAGVHEAGFGGAPVAVGLLLQGQRVHVGAQAHHAARLLGTVLAAMHQRHHAGFTQPGVDGVHAAQLERLHHAGRGVDLFKAQLGVGVQIPAKGGELGVELGHAREDGAAGQGRLQRQTHGLNAPPPCPRAAWGRRQSTAGLPPG